MLINQNSYWDLERPVEKYHLRADKLAPKNVVPGAREMAWKLRALAALPDDLGSIPSSNIAAHSCL